MGSSLGTMGYSSLSHKEKAGLFPRFDGPPGFPFAHLDHMKPPTNYKLLPMLECISKVMPATKKRSWHHNKNAFAPLPFENIIEPNQGYADDFTSFHLYYS